MNHVFIACENLLTWNECQIILEAVIGNNYKR